MISLTNTHSQNFLFSGNRGYNHAPPSFGGNYTDALINVGTQMLLTAVAKQQLRNLIPQNPNKAEEETDGECAAETSKPNAQNPATTPYSGHTPAPHEQKHQNEQEEESEPNEIQALKDLIGQLYQQKAYQAGIQHSSNFNNYMLTSFADQQIIRSIQLDGGRVVRQYSNYFVAQDINGNHYTVSRTSYRTK